MCMTVMERLAAKKKQKKLVLEELISGAAHEAGVSSFLSGLFSSGRASQ